MLTQMQARLLVQLRIDERAKVGNALNSVEQGIDAAETFPARNINLNFQLCATGGLMYRR